MRAGNYAWNMYKDLAEKVDSAITYRHTQAFWPAHTPARMDMFRHLCGVSRSAGFDLRDAEPAGYGATCTRSGNRTSTVLGGILDPYEGDIDPSQLTQALAKGARALVPGLNGLPRSRRSSGLRRANGRSPMPRAEARAEIVINAAGFYGRKVAEMAGLQLPVITLEHQYLVTEPVPELEAHTALFPLVRDPDIRFYLRRERNAFLLGSYAHAGRPAWANTGPPERFRPSAFP